MSEPITSDQMPARARQLRTPIAVQAQVMSLKAQGATNTEISKLCNKSRDTVARILSQSDIQQHASEVRSDMVLAGDLWKARRVMRTRLNKGSESAAVAMLRGFNVLRMDNNLHVSGGIGVMLAQVPAEWMQGWEQTTTNSDTPSKQTDVNQPIDVTPDLSST